MAPDIGPNRFGNFEKQAVEHSTTSSNKVKPRCIRFKAIGFDSVYTLDSDLSAGQRYPSFEQLGPALYALVRLALVSSIAPL